jgi:hypothetical protein
MKKALLQWMVCGFLMGFVTVGNAADQQEPQLSPAETAAVQRQIATLKNAGERHMAGEWTNAKKVAEMLCRPAALPILKRQSKGSDKVFLGTDDPSTLTLVSNQRLTGSGQVRTPQGWQDFTFTCDMDPATGKVTGFHTVPVPAKP